MASHRCCEPRPQGTEGCHRWRNGRHRACLQPFHGRTRRERCGRRTDLSRFRGTRDPIRQGGPEPDAGGSISYLSRLVIVREIAPRLGKDRPVARMKPRVFIMGFPGVGPTGRLDDLNAKKSYGRLAAHMNTVAGNEMLVLDAATRYPNRSFFGLNPGFIKTNIRTYLFGGDTLLYRFTEWMMGLMASSPESYAERLTPLLVSPDLEGHSGAMFDRKGRAILPSP